ncbi:MAG: DNA replication/repair protein RecF [Aquiluna sp.]|nr:DNA replication/repair protein RecF [Aquiluna sp.]
MWVRSIQLTNFRNYSQAAMDFPEGQNLVYGENGNGKTNLIEAMSFLSTLESHRVTGYQALIKSQSTSAQLSAKVQHESRELLVGVELNADSSNRYFLNGSIRKKASDLLGLVKTVSFAPEDLDLIRRDPNDRRRFLDSSLAQLKPRLAGVKADYERVLKQRNALLKSARGVKTPDLSTLDIWDDQLVSLGTSIAMERLDIVLALEPLIQGFYKQLSNSSDSVRLKLVSALGTDENEKLSEIAGDPAAYAEAFYEGLQAVRAKELERGLTLVGPHRDELLIEKAGLLAKTHASQGEAWSLALGLKLALGEVSRKASDTGDPILLLDDVFAVLDRGRRERLLDFVTDYQQVIITAADESMAPVLKWAGRFQAEGGGVIA